MRKEQLIINILQEGSTPISNVLISNYNKLGLSDQEMVLLIHLLYFQGKGNLFPSISELDYRMSSSTEEIMKTIQGLVRKGFIQIEENKDELSGIIYESYNIQMIYTKLAHELESELERKEIQEKQKVEEKDANNIYKVFESEFGRPLSPMELETISAWIDQDKYSSEMILYGLKEAVLLNKLNFRYIDKILFEWQKKNLRSIEEIKKHSKMFRNQEDSKNSLSSKEDANTKQEPFEFYNWLDE